MATKTIALVDAQMHDAGIAESPPTTFAPGDVGTVPAGRHMVIFCTGNGTAGTLTVLPNDSDLALNRPALAHSFGASEAFEIALTDSAWFVQPDGLLHLTSADGAWTAVAFER